MKYSKAKNTIEVGVGYQYNIHPCQTYQGIEEGVVKVISIVDGEDNDDIKFHIAELLEQLDFNKDNKALAVEMWESLWVEYEYSFLPNEGKKYLLLEDFINHSTII